jgi:hypothetical protein
MKFFPKSYITLVNMALERNFTISVYDGEAYAAKRSSDYKAIIEAIESVEEAGLTIRDAAGKTVGLALVIPFGCENDETVSATDDTPFMNEFNSVINMQTVRA